MKHILYFLVYFISISLYSQIQQKPATFKKINFIYKEKTNIYINKQGVYADTLTMKHIFKNKKYEKIKLPNDTLTIGGFIPLEKLSNQNKQDIVGVIAHTTHRITGIYDVEKNETFLSYQRIEVDNIKANLKKYLNRSYEDFYFTETINHSENKKDINYPTVSYNETYDALKKITWLNKEQTIGRYDYGSERKIQTNTILVNLKLDKHVSTTFLFNNCPYGIQTLKSEHSNTELILVNYQ